MRIIAIESSGRFGSLAALDAGGPEPAILAEKFLNDADGRTAKSIAPALKSLIAKVGWTPSAIELVAAAVGPGSFTGLRIGVTTAKTLAYATGAEIVGVNTLAAMADQVPPSPAPLWTILDAQRQELFVAKFSALTDGRIQPTSEAETTIVARNEWLAMLTPGDLVTGPPLRKLASEIPDGIMTAPPGVWEPTAAAVGRVAWRAHQTGKRVEVWNLTPRYYRASAAEEKAAQQANVSQDDAGRLRM